MSKIDFVPNEYVQQRESNRANFMYLILFAAMMFAIGVTFSIIKIRQMAVANELAAVNQKMIMAQGQIAKLEKLKTKSKEMMRTMLMTAELLEPVPRSVILACMTNNMPDGVSLMELSIVEEEVKSSTTKPASQYKAASQATAGVTSKKPSADTRIEIEGIAPSDIEVANYIARLGESVLLENVSLVESREHKIDNAKFRYFKLKAMLKRDLVLTKEDIDKIRKKGDKSI